MKYIIIALIVFCAIMLWIMRDDNEQRKEYYREQIEMYKQTENNLKKLLK